MMNDPFAVFGDDDDDDNPNVETTIVKMENENKKTTPTTTGSTTSKLLLLRTTTTADATTTTNDLYTTSSGTVVVPNIAVDGDDDWNDDEDGDDTLQFPWPNHNTNIAATTATTDTTTITTTTKPTCCLLLYRSPYIRLVQSLHQFGGSRGYIATQSLPPGTLLLIETPLVSWNQQPQQFPQQHDDPDSDAAVNDRLLHILYHHVLLQNNNNNSNTNNSNANTDNTESISTTSSQSKRQQQQRQQQHLQHLQEMIHDFEFFHPTKAIVDECCGGVGNGMERSTQPPQPPQQASSSSSSSDAATIEQVYNRIQELQLQYCRRDEDDMDHVDRSDSPTTNNDENKNTLISHNDSTTRPRRRRQQQQQYIIEQIMHFVQQQQQPSPPLTNRDTSPITIMDIYRLVLVLRYNALQSGMYIHAAMFNHSFYKYNCVKFFPKQQPMTDDHSQPQKSQWYSEIRTTRTISKGEPLTISYIPNIISHASRRHYLWQQHRFDIGNTITTPSTTQQEPHDTLHVAQSYTMECINNEFPVLSNMNDYKDTVTYNIETAVSELETMYHDIETLLQQEQQINNNNSTMTDPPDSDGDLFQQAKELEQASLELCISAEQELLENSIHVLLIPCRRLHVDICCMILQQQLFRHTQLQFVDRMKLTARLVASACQLRYLQQLLYGCDHFDIARTNLDLIHGIEELLSQSPKQLLNLPILPLWDGSTTLSSSSSSVQRLTTITDWSTMEYSIRKDYKRIKALYPDDAHEYIQQ